MSDAPDELESAMILGDPQESVSLDTIKAMARAVRDAGYGNLAAERDRITTAIEGIDFVEWALGAAHGLVIAIVKGEA